MSGVFSSLKGTFRSSKSKSRGTNSSTATTDSKRSGPSTSKSKSKIRDLGFLELAAGTDPIVEYVVCSYARLLAELVDVVSSPFMVWMVTESKLGRPVMAHFGFGTSCPRICPAPECSHTATTRILVVKNASLHIQSVYMPRLCSEIFQGCEKAHLK